MALPNSFSNNTNPTGVQLDANFAALGAIMTIPCAVSGANTLVLTPVANTPTVGAYANGQRYAGIAVSSNSGATTARVGSLAALNVYYDGPAGPTALAGNEILINCAFTLVYDSTLNSNAGGFHLVSSPASLSIAGGALSGSLSTPKLQIGPSGTLGASLTRLLSANATLVYTAIVPQTAQDQNALLANVALGDVISLGVTAAQTAAAFSGYVPAAGTVAVRCLNAGAGTLSAFTLVARVQAQGYT